MLNIYKIIPEILYTATLWEIYQNFNGFAKYRDSLDSYFTFIQESEKQGSDYQNPIRKHII